MRHSGLPISRKSPGEQRRRGCNPACAADAKAVGDALAQRIKRTFELAPDMIVLPTGTLAREFEGAVKAPRFVDRRA